MEAELSGSRYGWSSTEPSHVHGMLAPAVTSVLEDALAGGERRVLEIGCGNGAMARHLAARGYRVSAFDASTDGIEQARSLVSPVDWGVASAYDQDLGERFGTDYPVAIALEVVEHLYYPRKLFEAAKQCLRSDGLLVVSTPYHGYLKNLALALVGAWDKHHTVAWDGGHIKFFSRKTLGDLAAECGFREVSFTGLGRAPYLWMTMLVAYRRVA